MTNVSDAFETMDYGPAPEASERVDAWLAGHDRAFGHWIGGGWVEGSGGRFPALRPSDGSTLAQLAQATPAEVDRAVKAAREAQSRWRDLAPHRRARHLYALARGIQRNARLFAVLESMDNGKPIRESRDLDVPLVARHFLHHAGWAQLIDSEPELRDMEGVGVVGQVIPWNFPLLMLAWKVAPALAAGCTVVLKPAEHTSLTALRFAELTREVGLPDGVFNLVTGDGRVGAALVEHEGIDKVAFTGSTEVGRIIREATAGSGKRLSLELGGKSPFVVFDDADLDSVVEGVVDAIWFNQGEVCCAGSRILAHEGIAPRLIDKLRARMERLRMGDPLDKTVDMGAIVAPVQLERIRSLVAQGEAEGATVWQPSWAAPEEGWFYPPTLCTDVAPASTLAQVEVFGPVVSLMTFRTPAEAVELANDTRYGLAASVWTENVNLALDVAPAIKAGTVWVNCSNLFDAAAGFGGTRESGYGREGGIEGLREYLRPRWERHAAIRDAESEAALMATPEPVDAAAESRSAIDRTPKHYIGGRQTRPDAEASMVVRDRTGAAIAEVPRGNRKDVRNAVEAALRAQPGWAARTAHNRAQILYYLAENLALRADEIASRLQGWHRAAEPARQEVETTLERLFTYAAWADKWDGRVHGTPFRNVTLAMPEPLGVVGVVAPAEAPLLGLVSCVAPLIAMGNAVVAVPSPGFPLAAVDLYQLLDTSDVSGGVVNFVLGLREEVVPPLASHDAVDGLWAFADPNTCAEIERLSVGNMKRLWTSGGRVRNWGDRAHGEGPEFLHEAVQVKNVWVPYGE
ncbi:aldehyde dehydrogenase family protein [Gaopeijia maritima]|uniref:Aldehyde dehydrogenase family protein n=1 Tax=Gaopeijia maritima TaxID=3119007 RepID=A0ABU9EB26_9BACT